MSAMKRFPLVFALFGCSHLSVDRTFDLAQKGVKGVDIAAHVLADRWSAGVDDRVAQCKAQKVETSLERQQCMGKFGKGHLYDADATRLAEIYDELGPLLNEGRAVAKRIEKLVKEGNDGIR